MKEYIVPIYDDGRDDDSIFVGEIREKATEVVRCKDCKYADKNGEQCLCKIPDYLHWHESDFFCAYGEKVTE